MAVQGNIYREAAPSIAGPANLILHVGDGGGSYTGALTITNADPPDGFSENLDASVVGTSGGAITAGGTVTGLAPGGSDDSSLTVTVATDTAGTFGSDVMIAATSDGTGIDSLGTTGLGTYDVPVSFQVNNYATAAIQQTNINQVGGLLSQAGNNYTLDFGTLASGAADATTDLNLVNTKSVLPGVPAATAKPASVAASASSTMSSRAKTTSSSTALRPSTASLTSSSIASPLFPAARPTTTSGRPDHASPWQNSLTPFPRPFPSPGPNPANAFNPCASSGYVCPFYNFLPTAGGSVYFVDPHLKTPYTYQYNLSIEHELAPTLWLRSTTSAAVPKASLRSKTSIPST